MISCESCEYGDFKLKDETVSIRYIQTQINSKNAKPFRGKPKLLLVDADRGDDVFEELEIDPKYFRLLSFQKRIVNFDTFGKHRKRFFEQGASKSSELPVLEHEFKCPYLNGF